MAACPDIFDEIIDCLRLSAEDGKYACLMPETQTDFYLELPRAKKTPLHAAAIRVAGGADPAPPSPAAPAASRLTKSGNPELDAFGASICNCKSCLLHESRKNFVFGDGNGHAKLMFIGEGPGRDEDEQGLPFVGAAGQLLTRMINAMQFARAEVYIANVVKCRPPNNRVPSPDEAETCVPYLLRQIEIVKPQVIVVLGATPLKYLLGLTGIVKTRGHWLDYKGIKVMPTFHPAYLLRNPPAKKDVWQDLQAVMREFGKTPPPKGAKA